MQALSFKWFGHSTFLFESPGGKRILIDPWLTGNPSAPADAAKTLGRVDTILVTHGHGDHSSDVVGIGRSTGAQVVAPYELALWFEQKGLQRVTGMNPGGSVALGGPTATMVQALHSSSIEEEGRARYAGVASGYVIRFEDQTTVYFAGDTGIFGDMRLIAELYRPTIGFLPIGDLYTMGPEQAARACELLGLRQVVPMHYGTYPVLTGTPARLRELVTGAVQVLEMKPGETAT